MNNADELRADIEQLLIHQLVRHPLAPAIRVHQRPEGGWYISLTLDGYYANESDAQDVRPSWEESLQRVLSDLGNRAPARSPAVKSEPVLWWELINEAEEIRTHRGLGLASVWHHVHRSDYDKARATLDDAIGTIGRIESGATTERPIARVVSIEPNPSYPGAILLTVDCPHCGREHHHGSQAVRADGNYGHRAPHCARRYDHRGNQLPQPPGQSRGYIIRDERDEKATA